MSLLKRKVFTKFSSSLKWYPPAETKIPAKALAGAFLPGSDRFESQLCTLLGVDHCILGGSGRSLLCRLLNELWKKDEYKRDEVMIPGYTCYTVAASVVRAGLKIRAYDVEPETLNPSMDSIQNSMSDKTFAIIGQHLFGIPSSLDGLKDFAREKSLYFIEDAAQALGGKWKQYSLGTTGDFGLYSFGRGKPLPIGEGGALIGRDGDILKKVEITRNSFGYINILKAAAVQVLSQPFIYGFAEALPLGLGETVFDPAFAISPMSVSMKKIAVKALDSLSALNEHRNSIAHVYMNLIDKKKTMPLRDGSIPVFTRFPVMAGPQRISARLKRLGVRRMYPKAIQDEDMIRPYIADHQKKTPGASRIAESLITLPTHLMITRDLAGEIAHQIKEEYLC